MTAAERLQESRETRAHPCLKWAGGKRSLLPEITKYLPSGTNGFSRYFEPFVGGGAVFFHVESRVTAFRVDRWATLSDMNARLVRCYRGIRNAPENVIGLLEKMSTDEKSYYEVRWWDVDGLDDVGVAAWLLYMNRCCFNGLYRVNRKGKFNVPYGDYKKITFDLDNIRACSLALQRANLEHGDFEEALRWAKKRDLVYLDPPYMVPSEGKETFTRYTGAGFTDEDQVRLRRAADAARSRGATVIASNSVHARAVWDGWTIHEVSGRRSVGAAAKTRGSKIELLIVS